MRRKAELLLRERHQLQPNAFAELVVWRVPEPVEGSAHPYKYRLAYIVDGRSVVRFDNEAGKGDHRHLSSRETPYEFSTPRALLRDFWEAVDGWQPD